MKNPAGFFILDYCFFICLVMAKSEHHSLFTAVIVVSTMITSCSPSKQVFNNLRLESGYCDPPLKYSYVENARPIKNIVPLLDSALLKKYSYRSLMMANASGILQSLKELQLEQPLSNRYIEKKQQILARLLLVSTEISSTVAELDCESERAKQVADFILINENRRVRGLTVASIVVGAATGIVSSGLSSQSESEAVAIVGGVAGAALGFGALFPNARVNFFHPRNLLVDVWNSIDQSTLYPPFVWHMMTEKYFSNEQQNSVSHNMRERWIKFDFLGRNQKETALRTALLFGTGGLYSSDDLRARARMLDQVQATVRLMNQDLQGLIMELAK